MPPTIDTQMKKADGRPSGFDYLRIGLALCVTAYHTIPVCMGTAGDAPIWKAGNPLRPVFDCLIPAFFALSGFLVAGSLFRNSIPGFLAHRAARIFPALFCEVVISALIIGPFLTTYPLGRYFADPQFRSYFLNIIGDIHFTLPGLFHGNALPDFVNMQLWTIPYELQSYIILTVLSLSRIVQKPRIFILLICAVTIAAYGYSAWWAGFDYQRTGPSGRLCVLSFLCGVLIFVGRHKIPYSPKWLLIAAITAFLLMLRMESEYFAALPVAYVTVWLGLHNPRKLFIVAGADYSYGLYLYAFVIHQTVFQLFSFGHIWYANLAASLVIAGTAAYLSWNLLESKILHKKGRIAEFVEYLCSRIAAAGKICLPPSLFKLWEKLLGLGDGIDRHLSTVENAVRMWNGRT